MGKKNLNAILFALYTIAIIIIIFVLIEFFVRVVKPEISSVGTSESIIADSLYYETYGLRPSS